MSDGAQSDVCGAKQRRPGPSVRTGRPTGSNVRAAGLDGVEDKPSRMRRSGRFSRQPPSLEKVGRISFRRWFDQCIGDRGLEARSSTCGLVDWGRWYG